MNTSTENTDLPVALGGSNVNLSLNLSGLTKKNSAHNIGIPLPLGLIPQKPVSVSRAILEILSPMISYLIPKIQTSSNGDADNYQTSKTHVSVLEETRNRQRVAYDQALAAWNDFNAKAGQWTEISNKINRTEAEKAIKTEVNSICIF